MDTYYVELTVKMRHETGNLEAVIDPLMEAFYTVDGIRDADLGLDLHERTLTVSMYLDVNTEGSAINHAITATRTTFQAVRLPEPDEFHSTVKRNRRRLLASILHERPLPA